MIGYILGLGDRHVQNILIDYKTAEVIHIDFGICFEQALILRIPELVPFRLSRDIEAGFGISGTEGVFKKYNAPLIKSTRIDKLITIISDRVKQRCKCCETTKRLFSPSCRCCSTTLCTFGPSP